MPNPDRSPWPGLVRVGVRWDNDLFEADVRVRSACGVTRVGGTNPIWALMS